MVKRKQKEKEQKPIKIFTLDTETRGFFGEIFRVGIYDGQHYYAGDKFEDIENRLIKDKDNFDCHVYIHNLDFDLSKLAKNLLPTANFDESIFINNNVTVFKSNDITYHDSLKLLPSSLEKLSKDFGMDEEGKVDLSEHLKIKGYAIYNENGEFNKTKSLNNYFMNVHPFEAELNEYLRADCTALHRIIMAIVEISGLELSSFVNSPTTASLAMKVFKEKYNADYKTITNTNYLGEWGEFIESVIRQGYYGGRTEVFQPLLNDGFHYDVNSLYPYVMKANEFPVGYYELYDTIKAEYLYRGWKRTKQGAGFAWVKIYIPEDMHIPPLPKHEGEKLIFPVGKLSGVWTLHEIEMAERYGCKIEKIEQIIFFKNTKPVFKKFVNQFEELKNNSEGAKKVFAKLIQNSLYGKFGMRRERDTLANHTDELELELAEKEKEIIESGEYKKVYRIFYHPYLKKKFIETPIISRADYIQPHIAAYVTSYARILLYESIMSQLEAGEVVAYCDTDSMATSGRLDEKLVDNKEYGKWKLEAEIEEAIFLQPKLYTEKDINGKLTIKAKGIPKEILSTFTYETYIEILNKIRAGETRIELFSDLEARKKFATMLKKGEDFETPMILKKGLNLRAKQKRNMDYVNNTSTPHKVYNY